MVLRMSDKWSNIRNNTTEYMAYEVYQRTGVRTETPTMAVSPDGRITINAAAVRIAREARITSVMLLWDWANHRVAMKSVQRGDKNAYALSITGSHTGSLRAKSFFTHIGWRSRKRETIPLTWNEKERMFEAQLPVEHLESERWGVKRSRSD
jgi:hypothetical protein